MTDNEIIKVGDVCIYAYLDKNKSLSIVEIVKELSKEVVVVKFHQVISDDSGNSYFTYLCNTGGTMNVSRKYLNKIALINRQKEEIKRFGFEHRAMAKAINCYIEEVEELVHEKDNLIKTYKEYRTDAIKGFAKLVYKTLTTKQNWRDLKQAWLYNGECEWLENILNNLVKEKISDDNDQ